MYKIELDPKVELCVSVHVYNFTLFIWEYR